MELKVKLTGVNAKVLAGKILDAGMCKAVELGTDDSAIVDLGETDNDTPDKIAWSDGLINGLTVFAEGQGVTVEKCA